MKPLKDATRKMCEYYGKQIVEKELPPSAEYMKKYPLGFDDGQQAFGFYYNTPDNSLPVFWCESANWKSIFKRNHKIYSIEGVSVADEEYW